MKRGKARTRSLLQYGGSSKEIPDQALKKMAKDLESRFTQDREKNTQREISL